MITKIKRPTSVLSTGIKLVKFTNQIVLLNILLEEKLAVLKKVLFNQLIFRISSLKINMAKAKRND